MTDETPAIGDNKAPYSPEKIDELKGAAETVTAEAEDWLKAEVDDEETAEQLRDFLGKIAAWKKRADAAHAEDKRPWLDAGKAVDQAYAPIRERLDRLAKRLKPVLQGWLDKVEAARQERMRKEREAAEKARKEAERQAALAESTKSIEAEEAAERARKAADESAKQAERTAKERARVGSASGGARAAGYRTRRVAASVLDINQAFLHFRDGPRRRELEECLLRLANAELRAKDGPRDVPGFEVKEEKTVA